MQRQQGRFAEGHGVRRNAVCGFGNEAFRRVFGEGNRDKGVLAERARREYDFALPEGDFRAETRYQRAFLSGAVL